MNFYKNAKREILHETVLRFPFGRQSKGESEKEEEREQRGKDGHFVVLTKATAQGDGYGSDLTADGLTFGGFQNSSRASYLKVSDMLGK